MHNYSHRGAEDPETEEMLTVSMEGKRNWLRMSQYAYITTKEYVKLGCSLAAVQVRSSLRGAQLFWQDAWQSLLPHSLVSKNSKCLCLDDGLDDVIEYSLTSLLCEIAATAEITHGQSVSMTLLRAFRRQSCFVACAPREHQVAFEMVATDSAIPAMQLRGAPLNVTYEEATRLTSLLSEALACEWYWLTHPPVAAAAPARTPDSGNLLTESHVLALMLDNCPEFNLIWMAVSEASVWLTFLDALYGTGRPQAKEEVEAEKNSGAKRAAVYHHCSTALLNTNLANHSMLLHSLRCSAAEILVMEERYVPFLFADEDDLSGEGEHRERKRRPVQLPPCVRRVFLWRAAPLNAPKSSEGSRAVDARRAANASMRRGTAVITAIPRASTSSILCVPTTIYSHSRPPSLSSRHVFFALRRQLTKRQPQRGGRGSGSSSSSYAVPAYGIQHEKPCCGFFR
ncbi:fatty acid transporter protein [Trypanosoma rangeli]|uniref:Fatty acid transporter protein n=1 Tax=Trypanosoma rangeli TaxID=5698 RepID=A0A3R7KQY0_TRYRA|nr:fatty acid transporter protein [Trypanosoma rangeli]RNE99608.1 fatty acid transporter protein [Trypanosoma rangeli]|eukprot:RNE99608.1 fatty acid transporter protein [Trypanosoma rangeli]